MHPKHSAPAHVQLQYYHDVVPFSRAHDLCTDVKRKPHSCPSYMLGAQLVDPRSNAPSRHVHPQHLTRLMLVPMLMCGLLCSTQHSKRAHVSYGVTKKESLAHDLCHVIRPKHQGPHHPSYKFSPKCAQSHAVMRKRHNRPTQTLEARPVHTSSPAPFHDVCPPAGQHFIMLPQ